LSMDSRRPARAERGSTTAFAERPKPRVLMNPGRGARRPRAQVAPPTGHIRETDRWNGLRRLNAVACWADVERQPNYTGGPFFCQGSVGPGPAPLRRFDRTARNNRGRAGHDQNGGGCRWRPEPA
jgi:hypothetical protein